MWAPSNESQCAGLSQIFSTTTYPALCCSRNLALRNFILGSLQKTRSITNKIKKISMTGWFNEGDHFNQVDMLHLTPVLRTFWDDVFEGAYIFLLIMVLMGLILYIWICNKVGHFTNLIRISISNSVWECVVYFSCVFHLTEITEVFLLNMSGKSGFEDCWDKCTFNKNWLFFVHG